MNKMILLINFLGILFLAIIYTGQVNAANLGPDCKPKGLIAKGKEAWNPKDFWVAQIKEIQDYVAAQKTSYRLSMIERKRDKMNEELDAEEMKTMGIEQYFDPEFDREMQKTDQELLQMERKTLNESIDWGRKCTSYAKSKLLHVQ